MSYTTEERINDTLFKQHTIMHNGIRSSEYFVNGVPTEPDTYEEALLNAEKEESRRTRKDAEEQRIKAYQINYRGQVRLNQAELKKATENLVNLLRTALSETLEPYRVYSPQGITSQDDLVAVAEELLPSAKKLYTATPDTTNIAALSALQETIGLKAAQLKAFVTETVNQGITTAHDTKALKELLQLAGNL